MAVREDHQTDCCEKFTAENNRTPYDHAGIAVWEVYNEKTCCRDPSPRTDSLPGGVGLLSQDSFKTPEALLTELLELSAAKTGVAKIIGPPEWREAVTQCGFGDIPDETEVWPIMQSVGHEHYRICKYCIYHIC